jgi:hypothetical protein
MDISKLPKLSDTQSQPPPPDALQGDRAPVASDPLPVLMYRQPGLGVDIWISVIVGILLLMMGRDFGRYAVAKITHQPFHTGVLWEDDTPKAGQEKDYFDLTGYTALSDMGIFLFGAMLLFEAAAKTVAVLLKTGPLAILSLSLALLLTLVATIINLYACIKLFDFGITPIISGLAVAFGGWILYDEWQTISLISRQSKAT